MTKQQGIGLRLRKLFSNKEIIEDFSALNYLIDFYFPKYKLATEVDELGHKGTGQTKEYKRQKDLKDYLDCKFIRITPEEEKFKKRENKESLIYILKLKLSKLSKLKFKSNDSIKSKFLKWVVKKYYPQYMA